MLLDLALYAFPDLFPESSLVLVRGDGRWRSVGWLPTLHLEPALRLARTALSEVSRRDVPAVTRPWPNLRKALKRARLPSDRFTLEEAALNMLTSRGLEATALGIEELAAILKQNPAPPPNFPWEPDGTPPR